MSQIRDRLSDLKGESVHLQQVWQERKSRLDQMLEFQLFLRDAKNIDAMSSAHEVCHCVCVGEGGCMCVWVWVYVCGCEYNQFVLCVCMWIFNCGTEDEYFSCVCSQLAGLS